MSTTHDNATTWRDLRDHLTDDQIAYLESWEANPGVAVTSPEHGVALDEHRKDSLLFAAREFAETNDAAQHCAHLPIPPDARVVDGWHRYDDDEYDRAFDGTARRDDSGVAVFISGRQMQDGRIEREITLSGRPHQDDRLSADDARIAARLLLDAAAELDQLSQNGAVR